MPGSQGERENGEYQNLLATKRLYHEIHKFLPDILKRNPRSFLIVLGFCMIWVVLPFRFTVLLAIILAYGGYLLGCASRNDAERYPSLNEFVMQWPTSTPCLQKSKLEVSPLIDNELDRLLNSLLKSLINPWYIPLCKSSNWEFQASARACCDHAIMTLLKYISTRDRDVVTFIIYGFAKVLLAHLVDYRKFETSRLSWDQFMASQDASQTFFKSYLEELEHLRSVAGLLLSKLLPKTESKGTLLTQLLKEIIASNALSPLIDKLTDPDFINERIVESFSDRNRLMSGLEPGWSVLVLKGLSRLPKD